MNYKKITFLLSILFLVLISHGRLLAQSLPNDLSNIDVNQLTDSQIQDMLNQAQTAGLSDDQLVQMAQSRGLSGSQAQLLQARITTIRKNNGTGSRGSGKGYDTSAYKNTRDTSYKIDTIGRFKRKFDLYESLKPKIFGSDLFKNSNTTFIPNLKIATPVNYIVGPEDQINVNVYGNSVANWKLDVSPEGNINIPGIGILNVSGKTIEQVTENIKSKLIAGNYAIGKGTSVQVTIGNIRSIKVIVIGQVEKPGTYTLPSLATAFNALYSAGGPNDNGTYRQIEIIRNNRIISRLDIYDFLVKGDQRNNISLQDQDIIRVPTYRTRVELAGEVKIPGLFEVLPGETLDNVLNFAGGFADQAYTARIKVIQISDQQKRITDVVENDYKNYIPLRGDKYIIQRILERYENRVTIVGAVFRPGEYELQQGLTLLQLIKNAAGLKEDAFTLRGSISRLKPDNNTELIPFDLQAILNKSAPDILLQREDSVKISSTFDLRNKYTIAINGQVRKPGNYAYLDSMKVQDLIIKAGGFNEGASPDRIEIARRIDNGDPTSKQSAVAQIFTINIDKNLKPDNADFTLHPFDIVSVHSLPGYEKQKVIKVEGEVLYPGSYTISNKDEKISDIIKKAGGLTASADPEGGTLRRSNIAILGIDKNTVDTIAIAQERTARLNRLKQNYKDSTNLDTAQQRNNYVGIDMKEILRQPGSRTDLILEDGDVVRVPKQQQIVRVNGEVLYPSAVVYKEGETFKGYVLNAGGFSPNALKRGAYVVYPNGTVRGTKKFLFFNSHPDVKPGSEIYVPKKPASNPAALQTVLGLTTGLASLGAIILGILSLNR